MTKNVPASIASVQVGPVAPLGPQGVPSGFVKWRTDSPVSVTRLGLAGDSQADLSVHGGPDKAVYGYAMSNYSIWLRDFPQHAELLVPGGLGENLTIEGLDESLVCIGDIVRIGTTILQVTQSRQPCFKFALRFDDRRMPSAMMKNGCCGWYYRVIDPGTVSAGDAVILGSRPNPAWTIARFRRLIANRSVGAAESAELGELEGLAAHWRRKAREATQQART